MKFVGPDGQHYETRRQIFEKFYTIKNETNKSVVRHGDIRGQPFDLVNLSHCTIVLADWCEQINIDDLKGCRILVGACASSIFARNCEECTFTLACQQLRLRECRNCNIYLYSATAPVIELSSSIRFAPFNGAYPNHAEHMREARLDPNKNKWFEVFDFSDGATALPDGKLIDKRFTETESNHFKFLGLEEQDGTWQPLGECECIIPQSVPTVTSTIEEKGMQSFGIDVMRSGAHAPSDSTAGKDSAVDQKEHSSMKQETKKKMPTLPNELVLLIGAAKGAGLDCLRWFTHSSFTGASHSGVHLTVDMFEKKLRGIGAMLGQQSAEEQQFALEDEHEGLLGEIHKATSKESIRKVVALFGVQGKSGLRVDVQQFLLTCARLESLFEEQLQQALSCDHGAEPLDESLQITRKDAAQQTTTDIEAPSLENVQLSNEGTPQECSNTHSIPNTALEASRTSSLQPIMLVHRSDQPSDSKPVRIARTRMRKSYAADDINIETRAMKPESPPRRPHSARARFSGVELDNHRSQRACEGVFERVRQCVREVEKYHDLQVFLGIIQPSDLAYNTIGQGRGELWTPHRGDWISQSQLHRAFKRVGLVLSDAETLYLMREISEVAHTLRCSPNDGRSKPRASTLEVQGCIDMSMEGSHSKWPNKLCQPHAHGIWADAVRVFLLLMRRTCLKWRKDWETWWNEQQKNAISKQSLMKKEFRKALSGEPHSLSRENISKMLERYQVVPEDIIAQEIDNRLKVYTHSSEKNKLTIDSKRMKLLESEKTSASITKDLFSFYELDVKRKSSKLNFREWVKKRVDTMKGQIYSDAQLRNRMKHTTRARAPTDPITEGNLLNRRRSRLLDTLGDLMHEGDQEQTKIEGWKKGKLKELRLKKLEQKRQESITQEALIRRQALAANAFRLWKKLRKKNMYYSRRIAKTLLSPDHERSDGAPAHATQLLLANPRVGRKCWVDVPGYARVPHPNSWVPPVVKDGEGSK